MKKIALLLLLLPSFMITPVRAEEEASKEADPVTVAVEQDPEKIDALREEVQKKVQEKLDSIVNEKKRCGFVGRLVEKIDTGFSLEVDQGTKQVTLGSEVTIISANRNEVTFEQLEEDLRLIVMGYEQVDGTLEARRIVVTSEPDEATSQAIFAIVQDTSQETDVILATDKNGKEYELLVTKNTLLNQKNGDQKNKIKYDDILSEQKIVAIIEPTKSNGSSFSATEILVVSPLAEENQE